MQEQQVASLRTAVSEAMSEKEATFEMLDSARDHSSSLQAALADANATVHMLHAQVAALHREVLKAGVVLPDRGASEVGDLVEDVREMVEGLKQVLPREGGRAMYAEEVRHELAAVRVELEKCRAAAGEQQSAHEVALAEAQAAVEAAKGGFGEQEVALMSDLTVARAEVEAARKELATRQGGLDAARSDGQAVQRELTSARQAMDAMRRELTAKNESAEAAQREFAVREAELLVAISALGDGAATGAQEAETLSEALNEAQARQHAAEAALVAVGGAKEARGAVESKVPCAREEVLAAVLQEVLAEQERRLASAEEEALEVEEAARVAEEAVQHVARLQEEVQHLREAEAQTVGELSRYARAFGLHVGCM
jgi:chromosome segregation ATPase